MASDCGSNYGGAFDALLLGTSRLVEYSKNRLYGNYILPSGIRLYLCKYSVRNTLWSYDTGY